VVQHHRVGAAQRGARRLAQRAPRPEVAVAEGRQRVDGDAVEVSQQGQVLQAVVQEDQAQGGVVHQDLARAGGGGGVGHLHGGALERVAQHHGFVDGARPQLHDKRGQAVDLQVVARQVLHEGRLARGRGQVADADDGRGERGGGEDARAVQEAPRGLAGRVERGQRGEGGR
jgi:hypothetical protein